MSIFKKFLAIACLSLLSICRVQAAHKLDPLRYMYGTWRCSHYSCWSISIHPPNHLLCSELHIEKGRIYLNTSPWRSNGSLLKEASFNPEDVRLRKLFDDVDCGGLYGDYRSFTSENSFVPYMFSECQLGEFDVISLNTTGDLRTLFLHREKLIVHYLKNSTYLFMEKMPHVEKTYKGTQSSTSTFPIPENTSFVLMSYQIEDAATDLVVQVQERPRAKSKRQRKQTLFSTSTAATCGTKTVRMYVSPEATELDVALKISAGEGNWRARLEAY